MPPTLAILLLGVILLDSINMLPQAGKGTPRDGAAIEKLLRTTDWGLIKLPKEILADSSSDDVPDPSKLFDCLQSQKFSSDFWNGLTALQGIRLDYKSFTAAASTTSTTIGISTILLDMETFWKKDNLVETLAKVIHENDLEILGLMFTFMKKKEGGGGDNDNNNDNDNKPCRQLALTSRNKEVLQNLVEYLMTDTIEDTNNDDHVNLELMKQHTDMLEEKVTVIDDDKQQSTTALYIMKFDQQNSSASRKQVAPIIMGYWK
jgi:exopolyphosphatase